MRYSFQTLPSDDNPNRFCFCLDVKDEVFIQRGKMIAYYGALRFERLGASMLDILVKESFNAPLHVNSFVVVHGRGKLILGDRRNDIASYSLERANMTVRTSNVLAFTRGLVCRESIVPGFLTLVGDGRLIASSNGPAHFMEAPCRVDPDALLGWADLPCPAYHYDYEYVRNHLAAVGTLSGLMASGEEKQMDFTGQGVVMLQSTERPPPPPPPTPGKR